MAPPSSDAARAVWPTVSMANRNVAAMAAQDEPARPSQPALPAGRGSAALQRRGATRETPAFTGTAPPLGELQRLVRADNGGRLRPIALKMLRPEFRPFVEACRAGAPLAMKVGGYVMKRAVAGTDAAIPVALLVRAGEIVLKSRDDKIVCRYLPD